MTTKSHSNLPSSTRPAKTNLVPHLQDWDARQAGADAGLDATLLSSLSSEAAEWKTIQDGQRILTTTPSVLGGCRAQVYRSAGATQWYTAVIVGVNEHTGVSNIKIIWSSIDLQIVIRPPIDGLLDQLAIEQHIYTDCSSG